MKTFLLILILIAGGFFFYYQYNQNKALRSEIEALKKQPTDTAAQPKTNSSNWSEVSLLSVGDALRLEPNVEVDQSALQFAASVDLTGDEKAEGIFVTANGAVGSSSTIFGMDATNNVYPLKVKQKDGMVSLATVDSAASALYSVGYKLLPSERGYYVYAQTNTKPSVSNPVYVCSSFEAYSWNNTTEMFEYNNTLSTKYEAQVCK